MVVGRMKQSKRLEDYQPGASREQVLRALSKVAKPPKSNGSGKVSHTGHEKKVVQRMIDIVIEKNLEAFKELERY